MIKILNLKLVMLWEYQNAKTFLQKALFQIGLNKFLWLKNLKTLFCGHILQKTNEKEFSVENVIKK